MEGTMATIMLFAADFAPKYWAYCNGQLLSIAQNSALFSLLGTTYGGNGTTTFALPNFQGRTAIGTGQGQGLQNIALGEMAGVPNITLNITNLPQHTHPVSASLVATSTAPNTDESSGAILAGTNIYAAGANGQLAGVTIQCGVSGQNQPVNIQQPYLGMNFVICMQGIFPSRA